MGRKYGQPLVHSRLNAKNCSAVTERLIAWDKYRAVIILRGSGSGIRRARRSRTVIVS